MSQVAERKLVDTSHFSGNGWASNAIEGTPEAEAETVSVRLVGTIEAEVGELSIKVGPRVSPDGRPAIQGSVVISLDGKPIPNVQKIVLMGDARKGWSAELTLFPLITRAK